MFYYNESYTTNDTLQDLDPTPIDTIGALLNNTFNDNFTTRYFDSHNLAIANTGLVKLSKEQVLEKAKKDGLDFKMVPDQGYTEEAYNLLAERQRTRNLNNQVIQAADPGFGLQMATGVIAGFADPAQLAADYLLGFGTSRLFGIAQRMGKANFATRSAIRAGTGALEGGLGAAALEIPNYIIAQEMGDDYDAFDVGMNIAFGTILGSTINVGFGAISDVLPNTKHLNGATETYSKLSPEEREGFFRGALASLINDSKLNLRHFQEGILNKASKELDQVKLQIQKARANFDSLEVISMLKEKKKNLEDKIESLVRQEKKEPVKENAFENPEAEGYSYKKQEPLPEEVATLDKESTKDIESVKAQLKDAFLNDRNVEIVDPNGRRTEVLNVKEGKLQTKKADYNIEEVLNSGSKVEVYDSPKTYTDEGSPKSGKAIPEAANAEKPSVAGDRYIDEVLEEAHRFERDAPEILEDLDNSLDVTETQVRDALESTGMTPEEVTKALEDPEYNDLKNLSENIMKYANCEGRKF